MNNLKEQLVTMKKEHDYLICFDSDGCVFDTMELKHKECFCPAIINVWGFQSISRYARQVIEYVNLYSKSRGINRFPAFIETLDLLSQREAVKRRGVVLPQIDSLRRWVEEEPALGNPALIRYCEAHPDDTVMNKALEWSLEANENAKKIVRDVPPFPFVKESLIRLSQVADIVVVSATPSEALTREWEEHGIDRYVKVIAGQEMGTKKECIALATEGRYEKNKTLMVGDAPGDYHAAKANGVLYYPINPGAEEQSWQQFYEEASQRFLSGDYAGEYETHLVKIFDGFLPSTPPWVK